MEHPNPELHQRISFVKSALRIGAGIALIMTDIGLMLAIAGGLVVVSELFGIIEELV